MRVVVDATSCPLASWKAPYFTMFLLALFLSSGCSATASASASLSATEANPTTNDELFTESLTLFPMLSGHLAASFEFKIKRRYNPLDPADAQSYNMFPRALGILADTLDVHIMHLAMTHGRWRTNRPEWMRALRVGAFHAPAAPTGIEIAASLPSSNWPALAHSLSGLLCASFNLLLPPRTTTGHVFPRRTFGNMANETHPPIFIASLPREAVCTENLTPWAKLLPAHGRSGLAALIHGPASKILFGSTSDYLSLHLDLKRETLASNLVEITAMQSLNLVFDLGRIGSYKFDSETLQIGWALSDIFGQKINGPSPLSSSSRVIMHHPLVEHNLLPVAQSSWTDSTTGHKISEYIITKAMNPEIRYPSPPSKEIVRKFLHSPAFQVHKSLIGASETNARLSIEFFNPADGPLILMYYDVLPWFITVYMHTNVLSCTRMKSTDKPAGRQEQEFLELSMQHAIIGKQPTVIEAIFELPPNSQCSIGVDLDLNLLFRDEYRPDPSRGFELGAGIVTFMERFDSNNNLTTDYRESRIPRVYSNMIQILLPLPDFSMPYNVIMFTSTVISLLFTTLFSATTTRLYSYVKDDFGKWQILEKAPRVEKD